MNNYEVKVKPKSDYIEEEKINSDGILKTVSISDLTEFPSHPFKVLRDDELMEIIESIKESGVLNPVIGREIDGKIQLISGHRRKLACEILGIETMPVIVKEMSDTESIIAMVDTNLHRERILPSEKAFAYKMKLEALSHKAGRPKNNSSQVATNYRADIEVGKATGESKDKVRRYIRLTHLIPQLLDKVDSNEIALSPAAELSFLSETEQLQLLDAMQINDCTPSHAQSIKLKKMSQSQLLSEEKIHQLLSEEKPNQKEKLNLKLEDLRAFFPKNYTQKQIEDIILKLVFDWKNKKDKSRNAR